MEETTFYYPTVTNIDLNDILTEKISCAKSFAHVAKFCFYYHVKHNELELLFSYGFLITRSEVRWRSFIPSILLILVQIIYGLEIRATWIEK